MDMKMKSSLGFGLLVLVLIMGAATGFVIEVGYCDDVIDKMSVCYDYMNGQDDELSSCCANTEALFKDIPAEALNQICDQCFKAPTRVSNSKNAAQVNQSCQYKVPQCAFVV